MQNLGFDPIKYLEIRSPKDTQKLSKELLDQISNYLVVRTIAILPEKLLNQIDSIEKLFILAQNYVPDYKSRVKTFLDDFKKEFNQNLAVK